MFKVFFNTKTLEKIKHLPLFTCSTEQSQHGQVGMWRCLSPPFSLSVWTDQKKKPLNPFQGLWLGNICTLSLSTWKILPVQHTRQLRSNFPIPLSTQTLCRDSSRPIPSLSELVLYGRDTKTNKCIKHTILCQWHKLCPFIVPGSERNGSYYNHLTLL